MISAELRRIAEKLTKADARVLIELAQSLESRNCSLCGGFGVRSYSNTATWRGGLGGAMITTDVCDQCWGSGDSTSPGYNLRVHENNLRRSTLQAELTGFSALVNLCKRDVTHGLEELLRVIKAQHNRRKLPDGVSHFWYGALVNAFAVQLQRYIDADNDQKHEQHPTPDP